MIELPLKPSVKAAIVESIFILLPHRPQIGSCRKGIHVSSGGSRILASGDKFIRWKIFGETISKEMIVYENQVRFGSWLCIRKGEN